MMGRSEDRLVVHATDVKRPDLDHFPIKRGFRHVQHSDGTWTVYAPRDLIEQERRLQAWVEAESKRVRRPRWERPEVPQ